MGAGIPSSTAPTNSPKRCGWARWSKPHLGMASRFILGTLRKILGGREGGREHKEGGRAGGRAEGIEVGI